MRRSSGGLVVVSGGQTGADRAALDTAIACGIEHGGWCPAGRWAEDGPIAPRYRLRETPLADPAQRTRWNVRDSDATVVFAPPGELGRGTQLTIDHARALRRPLLVLPAADSVELAARRLLDFVRSSRARVLNVAGPRSSEDPAIGARVEAVLSQCLERS